jgi:hypothetical protein
MSNVPKFAVKKRPGLTPRWNHMALALDHDSSLSLPNPRHCHLPVSWSLSTAAIVP